ncbi:MAG: efflux RND transporter periplasmic adaptor subunit [Patescibacteria group bacterium]|nr:efflux RND transporter periplasmic adaptor subunit [Patescibacteria group bacterium]
MNFFQNILKRKRLLIGILIVALAIGYWYYQKSKTGSTAVQYVTQPVTKGTLVVSVTGTGQAETSDQMDIKPQTDGRITALNVKNNQQVKGGDVIAIIDQQSAANSVAQARANLEQAQASYDKLMAGATDIDVQSQKLSIQSAQQSLDQAKRTYTYTVTQQQQAVDKALSNLLNADLEAEPSDPNSTVTLTLSGNYTGVDKGVYNITVYQNGNGYFYSTSGLGTESGQINRGLSQPLGNGLYVTFSSTGNFSPSTKWTVSVPNTKSANYLNNLNAYNTAVQNQKQNVDQAQAAIAAAQTALDKANLSLQNTVKPPTQADIASAKAQITSAQAQLANAQTAYSNTVLKAPFDGVVASVAFSAGDKVTAGTTIVTMITNQQVAKVSLNEVDVSKVKLGQKATMTFDAISGLSVTGKVVLIDTIGTVSQGVVSYNVTIAFDTQNDQVKPGMSVTTSIITDVKTDVLMVANAAVKSKNGQSYVQVLEGGKPVNQNVQVGSANETDTEIISGATEGQELVTQTIDSSSTTKTTNASSGSSFRIPGITGGGAGR